MTTALAYRWTGDSFEILPRHQKAADAEFVIGEIYTLEEVKGRSQVSHNHFFAALQSGWMNLPEQVAERFPTTEHLRKWCLIRSGYHDQRSIVAASKAEAQRIAAFIKPIDEFAVVVVSECAVTVYTAKSQSKKAMGAADFQASKQAVLDLIDSMLGVSPGETQKNAEQVA
jgi:hypothetical protein